MNNSMCILSTTHISTHNNPIQFIHSLIYLLDHMLKMCANLFNHSTSPKFSSPSSSHHHNYWIDLIILRHPKFCCLFFVFTSLFHFQLFEKFHPMIFVEFIFVFRKDFVLSGPIFLDQMIISWFDGLHFLYKTTRVERIW